MEAMHEAKSARAAPGSTSATARRGANRQTRAFLRMSFPRKRESRESRRFMAGSVWIPACPGMTAGFAMTMASRWRSSAIRARRSSPRSEPRTRSGRLLLESFDRRRLDHGQADIVEAFEQAVLAERIDVEAHDAAVRAANLLLLEIDRQRRVGAALGVVEQLCQIFGRDFDRQNAVLEAIVVKDVGEIGRDHAAYAEIEERPRRVLARRAAAEIVARHQ